MLSKEPNLPQNTPTIKKSASLHQNEIREILARAQKLRRLISEKVMK